MSYRAPLQDMRFVMQELAGLDRLASLPGFGDTGGEVVDAVLDEADRFASDILAPLNRIGDTERARWQDGVVTTPPGFRDAYLRFAENGWNGIGCDPEYGGQGMPKLVTTAVYEMWKAANLSFSLCPMLTSGAIEALMLRGSDAQKQMYLHNMVSGKWTGTMNLTESQAGSDLAAVRTRAVPAGDGSYRLTGQKIFITYGEHDYTENIIHLVLARTPDAPEGVKGISLFVAPKFLVRADGSLGARNDIRCLSIEHKLGIHGSPTCVLSYGEQGGATAYLVGEENRGLEYMFIMMNAARFAVGLEGLAIAERAYQKAVQYARERIQGTDIAGGKDKVAIVRHPDVRRMLMRMKAQTEAMRAVAYVVASAQDAASRHPDAGERARNQAFVDLMIPIVKGWSTETGNEVASLGVQVHGGMGFIEETGTAQFFRDARITTIYEGTTAIQANDLIGRKIGRDGGRALAALVQEMRALDVDLATLTGADAQRMRALLARGVAALERGGRHVAEQYGKNIRAVAAGSVPLLQLMGVVCGGWQMARALLAAQRRLAADGGDRGFLHAKIATARFYADHVLVGAEALAETVIDGGDAVLAMDEAAF
ncbi:MAG: 3-methylmercaptopropionyl-CoA dehydrogenase [Rhodocyclaceae bacterium]|nr:3-methylmercaptopropionyl-CoA dehydrogenase [Rhodocyclaceae bacterium]